MKTFFLAVAIILLATVCFADGPYYPSGNKTSDGAILATSGVVGGGIVVVGDGTNDCTLACYDNATAASGVAIFPSIVCEAANGKTCVLAGFERTVSNGVYCDVTTSGTCTYSLGVRAGK